MEIPSSKEEIILNFNNPNNNNNDNILNDNDKISYEFCTMDEKLFSLNMNQIKFCSFLYGKLNFDKSNDKNFRINMEMNSKEFQDLFNYITKNIINVDNLVSYDFWGFDISEDLSPEYNKMQLREKWMRYFSHNNPECDIKLLSSIIDNVKTSVDTFGDNLIQSSSRNWILRQDLVKCLKSGLEINFPIGDIEFNLSKYEGHVVLAGGSIISILLCKPVNDFDFFFVGLQEHEADLLLKIYLLILLIHKY